jgi:hypothetical protein
LAYYRYRSYRYRNWGNNPPSKYSKLQALFGEAVEEIKRQFFKLDPQALSELLLDYGEMHGKSAASYAKETMPKWKSGTIKLSGQTLERLIELVPPYLSAKQRLEILQMILSKNKRNASTQVVKINVKEPNAGMAEVDAALRSIKVTDELAFLPPRVMEAAQWLYDDDVTAARAVMISIASAETSALMQSAEREINLLKRTLSSGQIKAASYSVQTPGGNLNIVAYTPSKCFVATTCFGQDDERTRTFRNWRDDVLIHRPNGRRFIVWYYNNGEYFSQSIAKNKSALWITRSILTGFSTIIRLRSRANIGKMRMKK